MEWAAVDAFNGNFEFVKVQSLYESNISNTRKKRISPKNSTDFEYKKNYAELLSGSGSKKNYRPVRIRFLGSKFFL